MAKARKASKGKGKAVKPTQDAIKALALTIMERDGVGFVKANIRARRELGLVPSFLANQAQEASA